MRWPSAVVIVFCSGYTARHGQRLDSAAAVGSELDWLTALRADTGLSVPEPFRTVSGELTTGEIGGLLTDLFLEKGSYSPAQLLASIRDLLDRSPLRPRLPAVERTPVCLPRTVNGDYGLTCSECLRFFAFVLHDTEAGKPKCAACPYCKAELPYFVDPIPAMAANQELPAGMKRAVSPYGGSADRRACS